MCGETEQVRISFPLFALMLVSGGGLLPHIGYTGMCRWKGYGFQAIYSVIGSSNHRKLV